jgi:glutathione S-transferase
VRIFLAEKSVTVPVQQVDILGGENRKDAYQKLNPAGQTPCLELDDGSFLAETFPICEYIEELNPSPALIGSSPQERALTRMWTRRVELKITGPMADGFRFGEGLPMFKERIRTIPAASADLKAIAREGLDWLDAQLGDRPYVAGERFSLADITLFAFLEFGRTVGQPFSASLQRIGAWYERVGKRPAVTASAR